MDDITISNVLKSFTNDNDNYLGILTLSQLYNFDIDRHTNSILVFFIENIFKKLGHWVAILKIKNKIYFLDSFGLHPKLYNFDFKHIFKSKLKYDYYYLNLQTQSDSSSTCGAYTIFFIHTIIWCKYTITCFKKSVLKNLSHKNNILNDHFIIKYMYKHFKNILPSNCQELFCNTKFIINRENCVKLVCKNSSKVTII